MARLVLPFALVVGLAACGDKDQTLRVTGLEPVTGDVNGGTYVRVTGNGFTAQSRMAKVYFGKGTSSRQGQVSRFINDKELVVIAPGGKPDETVDVILRFEPGGEITIPKAFTFVEKGAASVEDLVDKKPSE